MGVEPTEDFKGPPTDLKSAKSTGTHTLPNSIENYSICADSFNLHTLMECPKKYNGLI